MIIRRIGTEKECRNTMCKIHSERPFKEIWYEVSGLHRWNYDDEELEEDHTFMLLEYRGNANGY